MDYCTPHFGKSLNELTKEDIQNYFNIERTETDQIEFKSFSGQINIDKIEHINTAICALLNSNGGVLIWGAPEGKKVEGKKEKVFKGELTFSSTSIEKDTLISKISDKIIPLPNNIRVKELADNKLFVFEIDQSEYAPHQTGNIYYMRIDGQSRPAPHHYVDALFKKVKYPNIECYAKFDFEYNRRDNQLIIRFSLGLFNWSPLMNEENLSIRIVTNTGAIGSHAWTETIKRSNDGKEYSNTNLSNVFSYGEPVIHSDVIIIHNHERMNNENIVIVSFGGKFSPRKFSMYQLHLDRANEVFEITEKKENINFKDYQDRLNVSKESVIDTFLNPDKK
jgi:hypothetical protein